MLLHAALARHSYFSDRSTGAMSSRDHRRYDMIRRDESATVVFIVIYRRQQFVAAAGAIER